MDIYFVHESSGWLDSSAGLAKLQAGAVSWQLIYGLAQVMLAVLLTYCGPRVVFDPPAGWPGLVQTESADF